MRRLLWFADMGPGDQPLVGSKAYNLAKAAQLGLSVPMAFCLTTAAYEEYLAHNALQEAIESLLSRERPLAGPEVLGLRHAIRTGCWNPGTRQIILDAYQRLAETVVLRPPAVAVRSSATAEDLPGASYAGQQSTGLNVRGLEKLLAAIQECWSSLWSPPAVAYRARLGRPQRPPTMAVLVQLMVDAETAGVSFSIEPATGEAELVVEATFGLGETVVRGGQDVDRYVVDRRTLVEKRGPTIAHKEHRRAMSAQGGLQTIPLPAQQQHQRTLTTRQVEEVARSVLTLEGHFGCPQDVEWAFADGHLHVLQSRPVTTATDSYFTDVVPEVDSIWTAGFVNERFSLPVSPLGWSTIRELLDELAFRAPLRYLGLRRLEHLRISRLYRGHPYVNVLVFQTLYKVFPSSLLPEDAHRYFPGGRTELRRNVTYPRGLLDPGFLVSMLRHFLSAPATWSPWHNYRVWADFAARHEPRCAQLEQDLQTVEGAPATLGEIWAVIERTQQLNAELLSLHRWSLTHADVLHSLLRRLLRAWSKCEDAMCLCAWLVAGLPNKTWEVDAALRQLAMLRGTAGFEKALAAFLERYGHRSYHLDIYHPPFRDDPLEVTRLLERLGRMEDEPADDRSGLRERARRELRGSLGSGPLGYAKKALFDHLVRLVQVYIPLREEQRFCWQRTLATMRRLSLLLGEGLQRVFVLVQPDDVFFLTKDEVETYVRGSASGEGYAMLCARRREEFLRLCREFEVAPAWSYPPFLRGNQPLLSQSEEMPTELRGQGVSPGVARGRVVVVCSPAELGKVRAGDVLVAPAIDPGWTPAFGLLSAVIMEHGGQLSHAAIVAREYGLPAVTGISGVTQLLEDGDQVVVDGLNGLVAREAGGEAEVDLGPCGDNCAVSGTAEHGSII